MLLATWEKGEGRAPPSIPTASDRRGILVSLVTMDTTMNLLGSSAGFFPEASHALTFHFYSWDPSPSALGWLLHLAQVSNCFPLESMFPSLWSGNEASAFPLQPGTLFTVAHLGPSWWGLIISQRNHGSVATVEGWASSWCYNPLGRSSRLLWSGTPSSPDLLQELMARSKSTAFSPTYTPASWLRLLGSLRKEKLGPVAKFSTPRHVWKNPAYFWNLCCFLPLHPPDFIPYQSELVQNMVQYLTSTYGESHSSEGGSSAESLSFLDDEDQRDVSNIFVSQSLPRH